MRSIIVVFLFLFSASVYVIAQNTVIDGNMDEAHWKDAVEFNEFKTFKPAVGNDPSMKTRVFVTHDSVNLYIAVMAFDSDPSKIMANLTNRDNLKNDDVFTVEIDANGSSNSNIFFRVNPLGVQEDGVITKDEEEDLNPDKVWYSKGILTDFGYQLELSIPFQSLRFKWSSEVKMKMGFMRKIYRNSELVVYPEYQSELSNRLMQREVLYFSNIKKQRILEVIPSITYIHDDVLNNGNWENKLNKLDVGVTGKIGLTSDLVFEFTYNPDFSQIESDAGEIDINLRNPLFFPEKRPFFQEGIELFNYGGQGIYRLPLTDVVHTRNIVNPLYGVKLTGNLGKNYSIASIISTDERPDANDHYQIVRMQRKLNDDNYIGLTYTGKETAIGYNRVGGLDGKVRINGKSSIEYNFFRSFSEDTLGHAAGNSFGAHYNFKDQHSDFVIGYYQTDQEFNTETGYLSRQGLHVFPVRYNLNIPLRSDKINKIGVWLNSRPAIDMTSNKFEYWNYAGFELYFKNESWMWMGKTFDAEIFQGQKFDAGKFFAGYFIQLNKFIYAEGYAGWGNQIYYDPEEPFQGYGLEMDHSLLFSPTSQLKIEASMNYNNFYRSSNKEFIYEYMLTRLHATYQVNKNLFVRAVGEYNFYKAKQTSELLISFTYIPGTVIQLGYNMNAERNLMDENLVAHKHLMVNKHMLFFKASYLFKRKS